MKASLDTNIIIHFYKANCQNILFDLFKDEILIYEQIRNIELNNHGKEILSLIDSDITNRRIILYTEKELKDLEVLNVFREKVRENRILYNAGDVGEVYAISLAQTLGACSLLTNDTKQGGPYMSLLQFNDEVMPFNFTDILILRYLFEGADEIQTVTDFNKINETSNLNISFKSQLKKFIKRFLTDPYNNNDKEWIEELISKNQINNLKEKFQVLKKAIESAN